MKTLYYMLYNKTPTLKHGVILHVGSKETDRTWTDRTEQYASKEECIKQIKKGHSLKVSRTARKSK